MCAMATGATTVVCVIVGAMAAFALTRLRNAQLLETYAVKG